MTPPGKDSGQAPGQDVQADTQHQFDDLNWLNESTRKLLALRQVDEILDFAGLSLQKKLGDCVIVTFSRVPGSKLQAEGVYGLDESILSRVSELLGFEVSRKTFAIEDRLQEIYDRRKLHRFPGGLETFTEGYLPSGVSKAVAALLDVEDVYTIGLAGEERVVGNLHIFTRRKNLIRRPELVESFVYQTALALERAMAIKDLSQSEEFHREIFRSTTDALIIADLQGKIVRCNQMACTLYGYSMDEMIGDNAAKLIHPDYHFMLEEFQAAISRGELFSGETVDVRRDGTTFTAEVRGRGINIQDEKFLIASIRDITSRKETERELDFRRSLWESLLENTPDLVYFKDQDQRLILASNAYGDIFDADPEALIGKTAADLWPEEAEEIMADERKVLRGEPIIRKERQATNPIGEKQWYSLTKIPIYEEGEVIGFFAIDKNITERKRAEKQRERNIRELALINEVIVQASRMEDIDQICQLIAEKIHEVNPDSYVAVSLYDPRRKSIRVRSLVGIGTEMDRIINALGARPTEIEIEVDQRDLDPGIEPLFTSGKVEQVPGGLYDITRGKFPKLVCESLERMMGVDGVFIAGFGLADSSQGGVTIFRRRGEEIHFQSAIETITSHVSLILERRQAHQAIKERTAQLEAFQDIEQKIISEIHLDELLSLIVTRAVDLVEGKAGGFSIHHPEKRMLEYTLHTGEFSLPENKFLTKGEGLAGHVWEKGETVILENYATWEGRLEGWAEAFGEFSEIGVPVYWKEQFLGVLEVMNLVEEGFTTRDAEILEYFATQAAIAIKNARLFENERKRRQEAETLREISMTISKVTSRSRVLNLILDQLQNVLPYDSASIQLIEGEKIVVEAVGGVLEHENVLGRSFPIQGDDLLKPIIEQGETVLVANVREHDSWLEFGDTAYIHSWIGVPLEVKGERIGVLTVDHGQVGMYSERHGELAKNFANQAAIVIENARLFEESERKTRELTALYESNLHITRELQPDSILEQMADQVEALFEPDTFLLARFDPAADRGELVYTKKSGELTRDRNLSKVFEEHTDGLLNWIIRHQSSLLVEDMESDTLPVRPQPNEKAVQSWLGAPLLVGDRLIGAMALQSFTKNAFHANDQRLLELMAGQTAIALENSRLFDEAQLRMKRITSLREIDRAISGTVDLQTTLEVLIGQLLNTLDVDAAAVLLYNNPLQSLEYVTQQGFHTNALQNWSFRLGEGQAGLVAFERRLIYVQDLDNKKTMFNQSESFQQEGFVTYFGLPLQAKGELVGVLEVFHRDKKELGGEWLDFLEALADQAAIAIDRLNLFNELKRSNLELIQAYDATIEGWARAIELRDVVTQDHSRRVEQLTVELAVKMGLREEKLAHIRRGALLHDIGKMAIPDRILLKPGTLTEEEWEVMERHPQIAYELLSSIDFLRPALDIPYSHHERWDGSGYPLGLSGEDIPLEARIFAVVDVWDALLSDRPYREAWSEQETLEYLQQQAGEHFDPQVVEAFLEMIAEW